MEDKDKKIDETNSSKNNTNKKINISGVTIATFFGVTILILLASAFFTGSIMSIFGFEYENLYTLFLFFTAVLIFSLPLELLANAIPNVLTENKIISKKASTIFFYIVDVCVTFTTMTIVDKIMLGIQGSSWAYLVISLLMATPTSDSMKNKS